MTGPDGRRSPTGILEGDGVLVLHVVAHEIEAVGDHHGIEGARSAGPRGLEHRPDGIDTSGKDMGVIQAMPQPQVGAVGQRMVVAHERVDTLIHRHQHFEFNEVDRFENEGQFAVEPRQLGLAPFGPGLRR